MTMRSKILAHRYQMVAANEIFHGCQEHFVTSILAVLRPKILIPGVTIYNCDDMTREALFLEEGEVEVCACVDAANIGIDWLVGWLVCLLIGWFFY